ncbi:MAG TPA: hypothetical protein DCG53_01990 [Syntrophus sp. (in: bacteria)]|nr:hypothetical protein [Syntrophus sp. (in: bacteria)]
MNAHERRRCRVMNGSLTELRGFIPRTASG